METTDHPLYNVFDTRFDTGPEEPEVPNLHDMPWFEIERLWEGMYGRSSSAQPPSDPSRSPGKNSFLQSSPSPGSGRAQFTPSSTNPDTSNDSSFEVEDGSYGASSVYTTSPIEPDYVHIHSFSSRAPESTTADQPPPPTSASGDMPSLAHRPREFSATPFSTTSHQEWPSVIATTAMDYRNTGNQQPAVNYGVNDPALFGHDDLVDDMPLTGVFGHPFRPIHFDNTWPVETSQHMTQMQQGLGQQFPASWGQQPPNSHPFPYQPVMDVNMPGPFVQNTSMRVYDQQALQVAERQQAMAHAYQMRLRNPPQHELVYPPVITTQHQVPSNSISRAPPETSLLHPQHHGQHRLTSAALHTHAGTTFERRVVDPGLAADSTTERRRMAKKEKPRAGGRPKGAHLHPHTRQKSSAMRKTGACWRCAMQRDQCDGNDPCLRCDMRAQKGQQYFFPCDRSKLPDFVLDFLPPSMTLMHQKQTIEDCVQEHVRTWDFGRPVDVYLTSGYGHALRWTLYEFEPKSDELLNQYQYFQDVNTGSMRRHTKYSPPLGITKLDPSDDTHFSDYLDQLMADHYLRGFGWICFEEENRINEFQAEMLAMLCKLYLAPGIDIDLRELLRKIIRMMLITYIMGHTLTISEDTLPSVISSLKPSLSKPTHNLPRHTSPRLANRQLKFFFHVLRGAIYEDILKWLQATLHTSGSKESSWLPAFCVMLGFGMVLEEVQRTIQIQADSKAQKKEKSEEEARQEASNACGRIDERYRFLIGLFQCKYRDRKWTSRGSFGYSTPTLGNEHENEFLGDLHELLAEQKQHLRSRENVTFSSENQCKYTSRLVARFLLPFLGLPAQ